MRHMTNFATKEEKKNQNENNVDTPRFKCQNDKSLLFSITYNFLHCINYEQYMRCVCVCVT